MTPVARWAIGAGAVAAVALVWASQSAAQPQEPPAGADAAEAAPPAAEAGEPEAGAEAPAGSVFDHDAHRKAGVKINKNCGACHDAKADGTLLPIASKGHQPCLDADCHAMDFMSVGARNRKANSPAYQKAVKFCAGCHPDGTPKPSAKARVAIDYRDAPSQFHIEMGHFQHVEERARCRDCHVVDENTFALVLDSPGHAECGTCHESTASPPRTACGSCHDEPGPAEFYTQVRKGSDVRSCGSPSHQALSAKRGETAPCFKHERVEHRQKGGARIECNACHYMFEDKKHWGKGRSYDRLQDIKAAPLIDNNKDIAHTTLCGDSGCHAKDVRPPPRGNCTLCHSAKITQGLFD